MLSVHQSLLLSTTECQARSSHPLCRYSKTPSLLLMPWRIPRMFPPSMPPTSVRCSSLLLANNATSAFPHGEALSLLSLQSLVFRADGALAALLVSSLSQARRQFPASSARCTPLSGTSSPARSLPLSSATATLCSWCSMPRS